MTDDLTILGNTVRRPVRQLETFDAPDGCDVVEFTTDEFTSMCPVTGQPDFATLTIRYGPDKRCIESKSLKLYLWSFRDESGFCEALAVRIADDIMAATDARWVEVVNRQNIRGGIATTATARRGTMPGNRQQETHDD